MAARKCLQKEPDQRLRDIGDARLEIEEALTVMPESRAASAGPGLETGDALGLVRTAGGCRGHVCVQFVPTHHIRKTRYGTGRDSASPQDERGPGAWFGGW